MGKRTAHRTQTHSQELSEDTIPVSPERTNQLLCRIVELYEKTFQSTHSALDCLEALGIGNEALLVHHRVGYCDGSLLGVLPKSGAIINELEAIGVISDGVEYFLNCIVFPVYDDSGVLVNLWGLPTEGPVRECRLLPGRPAGLWNSEAAQGSSELFVTETVIEALSLIEAGYPNTVAAPWRSSAVDFSELSASHVKRLRFVSDREVSAEALPQIDKISCSVIHLEEAPDTMLKCKGRDALAAAVALSGEASSDLDGGEQPPNVYSVAGGVEVVCDVRHYRAFGIEKNARRLKATIRLEHAGRLHIDTVDLYLSKSRLLFARDISRIFDLPAGVAEADISRIMTVCESDDWLAAAEERLAEVESSTELMSRSERQDAEMLGRDPDLIGRIIHDFDRCGLVGEDANKLLCYIAAVSRKMESPLSVLTLSSSGAGKSALQDAVLRFCPPEDVVKLTSLSGRALFYKDENSLKHRLLALEEGAGAQHEASFAIRNLISSGELITEATTRDAATGKLSTMANRVLGPTSVFFTVTDPNIDPETRSRFFVIGIDESREQTERILEYQRHCNAIGSRFDTLESNGIIALHRNFQRLLRPVAVMNPYSEQLVYGDGRLQARRDQPKYLELIRAMAFLHQMQKTVKELAAHGKTIEYIEVDRQDIAAANRLALELLVVSLDELSLPSRNLLRVIEAMTRELKQSAADAGHVADDGFTRRDIREYSGWSNYRVHTHIQELVELEYLIVQSGRNGNTYRYRLNGAYEITDGYAVFRLTDPATLKDP